MQNLSATGRGGRWRQTDAAMDVESLGEISVSSSVERQAMREQLDAVRQTLNTLASGAQPGGIGVSSLAPAGLESVLSEISSKLSNIEGLYASLTTKIDKVDLRVEDSERHIKDLQHFSASTIHETARLVDYVGGRTTPNARPGSSTGTAAAAPGQGMSSTAALRARHMAAAAGVPTTPPAPTASPSRSTMPALDYVPGHMTATIQQHAAQIHKLIAGLDFLEAHIIRQDQVVEGVQKQLSTVARDIATAAESRSPSELSLRMHDMSELLNKLRAHMYKVEKKSGSNEAALAALADRMQAVELAAAEAEQRQQERLAEQQAAAVDSVSSLELGAAKEELRSLIMRLDRDVVQLRDQVSQAVAAPRGAVSDEEGAEMRRQLTYLMSQVPALVMENTELKGFAARATQQLAELSTALEQQQQQPEPVAATRADLEDALLVVGELSVKVAGLQEQVSSLEARLGGAASTEAVQQLSVALQSVREAQQQQAVALADDTDRAVVIDQLSAMVSDLQGRVADLDERMQDLASGEPALPAPPPPPEVDGVVKIVGPVPVEMPAAAVLAAEVAAAARANIEEQFGQLRHKVELAAEAAAAAEEAARRSAESAAAAAMAAEAQREEGGSAVAALQENVVAMMAGVEQEQAALKQQLALLASQVSQDQGAISSGLLQVQEQVAACAAAATEAAACAQLVQEQQAVSSKQEQVAAAALQAVQVELREQVAGVMERLKERVEQGVQQMDAQVAALSEQLSGAIRADQLEAAVKDLRAAADDSALRFQLALEDARAAATEAAERYNLALQDIRTTTADAVERYELAAGALDELRSELVLLTRQHDVMQSRVGALEAAVGLDARMSPVGSGLGVARGRASGQSDGCIDGDEERGDGEEDAGAEGEATEGAVVAGIRTLGVPVSVPGGSIGGGLLDLVAELRARVGGLEGTVEAAAADMEEVRCQLQGNALEAEDRLQQATAQLLSDLQGLSAAMGGIDERVASTAAGCEAAQREVAAQAGVTSELAAKLEEMQARLENEVITRVQETSAAVSSLTARLARDYVNREQLGAIFQARADMKRAVDELATVFDTGRLLRTMSSEDASNPSADREVPAASAGSGTLSPRLVSALEDLAGKQAELEQQVKLALYRTEGAIRQEEVRGIHQAMMTLEMQFRRLSGPGAGAASGAMQAAAAPAVASEPVAAGAALASEPAAAVVADVGTSVCTASTVSVAVSTEEVAQLRARVEALEVAFRDVSAASPAPRGTAAEDDEQEATAAASHAGDDEVAGGQQADPLELTPGPVRLQLYPENPAQEGSPVRVRLVVWGPETDDAGGEGLAAAGAVAMVNATAAAVNNTDDDQALGGGPAEDAAAEPSLSQMLLGYLPMTDGPSAAAGAGLTAGTATTGGQEMAVMTAMVEELQELRRLVGELAKLGEALQEDVAAEVSERQRLSEEMAVVTAVRQKLAEDLVAEAAERKKLQEEVAVEAAERQRLVEAFADLQERLDSQVNATASTAAMLATMATDQQQQRVRLSVQVGGPEADDLASLAAVVSTLTARLEAAEDALASAFVVRTPRSPTRSGAAAAAAAARAATPTGAGGAEDGGQAAASEGGGTGGSTNARTSGAVEEVTAQEEGQHEGMDSDTDSHDEGAMRPALGLMVPVLPREVEQQIAKLQAEVRQLDTALGLLGGRVDGLEAADALEEVRAAASQIVLESIPGMVSQQVAGLREEMEALVSRQGEPLAEMATQAARDAAEAVLAVREASAEARQAVTEALAAQVFVQEAVREAAAEAAAARDAAAKAAAAVAEAREATEAMVAAASAAPSPQAAEPDEAPTGNIKKEAAEREAAQQAARELALAAAREVATEVASSLAQSVAADVARDIAAEAASSVAREVAVETATTAAREVAVEAATAAAREVAVEAATAAAREVAVEAATATAREVAVEAATAAAREVAVEAATAAAREVAVEAATAAAREVAVEAATAAAREVAVEAATAAAREVAVEAATAAAREVVVEASTAAAREVAVEVATAAAREVAVEAATAAAQEVAVEAATAAAREVAVEVATAAAREVAVETATAAAREVAVETATAAAREVAVEAAAAAALDVARHAVAAHTAAFPSVHDEDRLAQLAMDVKDARQAVGSLTQRFSDVEALRDQVESLAAQVRRLPPPSSTSESEPDANTVAAGSQPPCTPTAAAVASLFTPAATALILPPPNPSASPAHRAGSASPAISTGGARTPAQATAQQAAFLARMVAAVKGYSNRLHAQYSDAEETGTALAQVDHTLEETEARFADVRDPNSPAFAEALVMILEQVAALRYIGSQTHPAVQQMVLEHENRLDQLTDQLKCIAASTSVSRATSTAGGALTMSPASSMPAPAEASATDAAALSNRLSLLEAEVSRVAGQQAALDSALGEILSAANSIRQQAADAAAAAATAAIPSTAIAADGEAITASGSDAAAAQEGTAMARTTSTSSAEAAATVAAAAGSAAAAFELAVLAAKVRQLDESLAVQVGGLRKELQAAVEAGGAGRGGTGSVELSALDGKVNQLHAAATAMRNRLLALQEYVDTTQGMIKDMHVALGGLHRRVDSLEGTGVASGRSARVSSSGSVLGSDAGVRELQTDVIKLESRLLSLEASSLEAAHALAGLKGLAPRLTEAETRLMDACAKLSAALGGGGSGGTTPIIPAPGPGVSLPALSGSVRALERRLGGRLEAACLALESLAGALSAAGRIQAESTANPFKAISAAVNNPVVVALEKKMETMRSTVESAVLSVLEDLRRDQQQQLLESRLSAVASQQDLSIGGGSSYGGAGGGGLSFRV